jgi:hypothetical protein
LLNFKNPKNFFGFGPRPIAALISWRAIEILDVRPAEHYDNIKKTYKVKEKRDKRLKLIIKLNIRY